MKLYPLATATLLFFSGAACGIPASRRVVDGGGGFGDEGGSAAQGGAGSSGGAGSGGGGGSGGGDSGAGGAGGGGTGGGGTDGSSGASGGSSGVDGSTDGAVDRQTPDAAKVDMAPDLPPSKVDAAPSGTIHYDFENDVQGWGERTRAACKSPGGVVCTVTTKISTATKSSGNASLEVTINSPSDRDPANPGTSQVEVGINFAGAGQIPADAVVTFRIWLNGTVPLYSAQPFVAYATTEIPYFWHGAWTNLLVPNQWNEVSIVLVQGYNNTVVHPTGQLFDMGVEFAPVKAGTMTVYIDQITW